jgi:hypothetical protein
MRTIAIALVLFCTSGLLFGQSRSVPNISLSRRVPFFGIKERNFVDALLSFGAQEHIPIAIEYIDKAAFQQHINCEFRKRKVGDILNALTHPLGYRWSMMGPVVSVTHDGALVGKSNLLNARIPQFHIAETSMHEASLALSIHLYFVLNPNSGGIPGDSPGGNSAFRVGPFNLTNATVRDILNPIVSQHRNGAWVVQQPPWTMGKDLGYGIWKVLEYDRTDAEYSRELQVRGLGLETP